MHRTHEGGSEAGGHGESRERRSKVNSTSWSVIATASPVRHLLQDNDEGGRRRQAVADGHVGRQEAQAHGLVEEKGRAIQQAPQPGVATGATLTLGPRLEQHKGNQ